MRWINSFLQKHTGLLYSRMVCILCLAEIMVYSTSREHNKVVFKILVPLSLNTCILQQTNFYTESSQWGTLLQNKLNLTKGTDNHDTIHKSIKTKFISDSQISHRLLLAAIISFSSSDSSFLDFWSPAQRTHRITILSVCKRVISIYILPEWPSYLVFTPVLACHKSCWL
jgi:hypothetical protein